MTKEHINKVFELFKTKNILIIGDVMVDAYIWGNVERISPEAPVPIVSISKRETRLGGAANVALNIKAMGANPIICSVVGNDKRGEIFISLLEKREMTKTGIVIDENRPTTTKTRVISNNQHLLRIDEETTEYISKRTEDKLLEKYISIINKQKIDSIIFQDYNKGVLTASLIESAISEANKKGIPISVDPKKQNFEAYKNVNLFKPNFSEFIDGLKINIAKNDIKNIFEASKQLKERINVANVLISLSELGVFISDGNSYHHILSEIRDITDVSGAGDTVIAVATLCFASGMELKDIAILSNLAGGLVCEKSGVVPVNKKELFESCLKTIDL